MAPVTPPVPTPMTAAYRTRVREIKVMTATTKIQRWLSI